MENIMSPFGDKEREAFKGYCDSILESLEKARKRLQPVISQKEIRQCAVLCLQAADHVDPDLSNEEFTEAELKIIAENIITLLKSKDIIVED
jgi:hypothetical protein